ncbi:hypothetical protein OSB04_013250 [Centaurea solstitialis]|uniref:Pentatricopeptide repeat-containing protein n=1 Tax=Centaurea solstitialis TaxID=347529 RepID=A0AA38WR60_9ASTR|nr:hypothetical protein OSB04_013250 [Centaurea solstitialis]
MLNVYAKCWRLDEGRSLFDPMTSKTDLLECYAIWGILNYQIKEAWKLFDEMPHRDTFAWNSTIDGYVENGCLEEPLELFKKMPKPAIDVFDETPLKNTVIWNSMISGYVKHELICVSCKMFDEMPRRDVVSISWTSMLNGYAKRGRLDEARSLFDAMTDKHVIIEDGVGDKNMVCWNAMLSGYVGKQKFEDANWLFDKILEKKSVFWSTMIGGCFCNALVGETEKLFSSWRFVDVLINNAILTGYIENRDIKSLWKLFIGMSELDVVSWILAIKDIIAWTVLIQGYLQNNLIKEARKLFEEMPHPDTVRGNAMINGHAKNGRRCKSVRWCRGTRFFRDMHRIMICLKLGCFSTRFKIKIEPLGI